MRRVDLVVVKAFGDLVIALTAAGRAGAAARVRLLVGAHLLPLLQASGAVADHIVLDHGEAGVPSFYDARKNGLFRAAASGWQLRRAIARVRSPELLFDRLGSRERFLAGRARAAALPRAANVYLAYAGCLGGGAAAPRDLGLPATGPVGIFPGSRLASKNLPEPLIRATIALAERRGRDVRLFLLQGERPDLEASGLPSRIVPRSFDAMIAAVAGCASIVSADSMPAHVAELRGVPVFVLSPVDNRYWLPRSSFEQDRWASFEDAANARLQSFLALEDIRT